MIKKIILLPKNQMKITCDDCGHNYVGNFKFEYGQYNFINGTDKCPECGSGRVRGNI